MKNYLGKAPIDHVVFPLTLFVTFALVRPLSVGAQSSSVSHSEIAHRMVVITDSADIHLASRTRSPVSTVVPFGGILLVQQDRGQWLRVTFPDMGWIRKNQVEEPDRAIPYLIKTVSDKGGQRGRRSRAAAGLGAIGMSTTPVVESLIAVMSDNYDAAVVQDAAADALVRLGPIIVPALLSSWNEERLGLRSLHAFMSVIERLGPEASAAVPVVLKLIDDPEIETRAVSIRTLGKLGPAAVSVIPKLVNRLSVSPNSWDPQSDDGPASEALKNLGPFAGSVIPDLMKQLFDTNSLPREEMISALGMLGATARAALPVLLDIAKTNKTMRPSITSVFGAIGPDAGSALPILLNWLADEDQSLRWRVATAIGSMGAAAAPAIPALTEIALHDADETVRSSAAKALGELEFPGASTLVKFTTAMSDTNPSVRLAAIRALGHVRSTELLAIGKLVEALWDTDATFQKESAAALRRIRPKAGAYLPKLIQGLSSERKSVRSLTAQVLGTIGEPAASAVPKLAKLLSDEDEDVRLSAIDALGGLAPASISALPELAKIALTADQSWIRGRSASALAQFGTVAESALSEFTAALKSPDPKLRASAVDSCSSLRPIIRPLIPQLVRISLYDKDKSVRKNAAESLRYIPPELVIDLSRTIESEVYRHNALADLNPETLQSIGAPALTTFIAMLTSRNVPSERRAQAAFGISQNGANAREAVPSMLSVLIDESEPSYLRDAIARELAEMGEVVVPKLTEIIANEGESLQTRTIAANLLIATAGRNSRGPRTMTRLCASRNTDWRLRRLALKLLATLPPDRRPLELPSIAGTIIGLREEPFALREEAALAYGSCKPTTNQHINPTVLIDVSRSPLEPLALREVAIESLTRLGKHSDTSIEALLVILGNKKENIILRRMIPEAVNQIDPYSQRTFKTLVERLGDPQDDKDVRLGACIALGNVHPENIGSAIDALLTVLEDLKEDVSIRTMIPATLTKIDPQAKQVCEGLIRRLEDEQEDTDLRIAACVALSSVDSVDAGLAFERIIRKSPDSNLRKNAKQASANRLERLERRETSWRLTSNQSISLAPRTPAQKPLTIRARVGTKRMPGHLIDPYVLCEPIADDGLIKLKATVNEALGFTVREFEQPPVIAGSGFQLSQAGAIIASAIANQLAFWGFEVAIDLERSASMFDETTATTITPTLPLTAEVSGKVHFEVDHAPMNMRDETTARLKVAVRIVGLRRDSRRTLFDRSFDELEVIVADGRAGRPDRATKAASIVVNRFIQKLFNDSDLEQKLVAFKSL